jgi:hypothetical protein
MVEITLNKQTTFMSEDFADLSKRKHELDVILENDEPIVMAALYDALAGDFDTEACHFLADKCRARAEKWKLTHKNGQTSIASKPRL